MATHIFKTSDSYYLSKIMKSKRKRGLLADQTLKAFDIELKQNSKVVLALFLIDYRARLGTSLNLNTKTNVTL